MCGIVGILSRNGKVQPAPLQRAVDELLHRGPDEGGCWISTSGDVGLAHRRLSIVDLVSGTQPLVNEDGTVCAVVNGELYDFECIRQQLIARGHHLRSRSDSEILIHLYEDEGVDCLAHLRGEFAFVLWDERERRLFAARDRFGIKPLFFAESDNALHLASEAKALFRAGVPCRWGHQAVVQHLYGVPSESQTYFEGVNQIRPGHFLLASPGTTATQHKYWDFSYPVLESTPAISDEDAVAQGRELLCEAVQVRLQGDVPVGVYLSGGIDSSGLIGIAAKRFAYPVEAFTVAWHDEEANEASIARETAELVGSKFHVCQVSEDLLADSLSDTVWHCEAPATLSAVAKFRLSEMVRQHGVKVVLTGEGADDVYAGYGPFKVDFKGQQRRRANQEFGAIADRVGFTPMWINRDPLHKLLAPGIAAKFNGELLVQKFLDETEVAARLVGRHPLNISIYLWSKIKLLHFFLVQVADRTEMGHSVEGRTPYLDHKLIDFSCSLPASLKIRNGQEKFILRECVRPYVTEAVYTRPKTHFINPLMTLAPGGRLRQLYEDTLNSAAADDLPFFAKSDMLAFLRARLANEADVNHGFARAGDLMLQSFVGFCLMQQRFHPT